MGDRVVAATLAGTAVLIGIIAAAAASGSAASGSADSGPGATPATATAPRPEPAAAPTLVVEAPETVLSADGLTLQTQAWTFGEASGTAWRVRVPMPGRAHVEHSDGVVPFTELLPRDDAGPWAAINGGFYERGPMGLVVSDGAERHPWSKRGGSGIFQWSPDAGPAVVHRSAWTPGPTAAVQSIDRLVDAGRSLVNRREGARSAARSAVAISDDALWLVALADQASVHPLTEGDTEGDTEGVQLRDTVILGLPLWTFAEYLRDHVGAETALNLDGAISTQLAVGAVDRRYEVRGERGTINAVVIRPPAASPAASPAAEPTP